MKQLSGDQEDEEPGSAGELAGEMRCWRLGSWETGKQRGLQERGDINQVRELRGLGS